MTEQELLCFLADNELHTEWQENKLSLWVDFSCLEEFCQLLGSLFDEGALEAGLASEHIIINLGALCEIYDIVPEHICSRG